MAHEKASVGPGNSGGIGFFSGLCLLFIGLKLTGHIDWPWLVVIWPMYVNTVVFLVAAGGTFAYLWYRGK